MIEVEIHQRRVFITDAVFNIFRKFQQIKASSYENGGILMGQVSGSNKNILICRASIPTHLDKNGENYFYRSMQFAQQIVDYEFYNSTGRNTYLGEWHTHPAKNATPSRQDIDMIKTQFKENKIQTNFLLLCVVGISDLYLGFYDGDVLYPSVLSFKK